jgi:hypothetical protein
MRLINLVALALIALSPIPASAVNKCTGPDGKTIFQDKPCDGRGEKLVVRPASGPAPGIPTSEATSTGSATATPAKPRTEAERIEEQIAQSQRERRRIELEAFQVPNLVGQINAHRAQCDGELRALQVKKQSANNNLAGAQWETSISQEMTAISTRCDTRNRELRDDLESVRRSCQALGGCK